MPTSWRSLNRNVVMSVTQTCGCAAAGPDRPIAGTAPPNTSAAIDLKCVAHIGPGSKTCSRGPGRYQTQNVKTILEDRTERKQADVAAIAAVLGVSGSCAL